MISRPQGEKKKSIKYIMDVLTLGFQMTAFIAWPLSDLNTVILWFTPFALILTSFQWWENYLSDKCPFIGKFVATLKQDLYDCRYRIYLIVSPIKMLLFGLLGATITGVKFFEFFNKFEAGWGNHTIHIEEEVPIFQDRAKNTPDLTDLTNQLDSDVIVSTPDAIYYVFITHIAASYFCYTFSKWACKIQIQPFSFAFPINLTVPFTVTFLIILCGVREFDTCAYHGFLPDYLFFIMPRERYSFIQYVWQEGSWVWLLWLFSQTWITRHIWVPKSEKNASTEKLFVAPMYNSLLIDQSVTLNRRWDDEDSVIRKGDVIKQDDPLLEEYNCDLDEATEDDVEPCDRIPKILICATMWHETQEEMMEFLKSILRLDEDQSARRLNLTYIQEKSDDIDPEYYELESKYHG